MINIEYSPLLHYANKMSCNTYPIITDLKYVNYLSSNHNMVKNEISSQVTH